MEKSELGVDQLHCAKEKSITKSFEVGGSLQIFYSMNQTELVC